ncbi:hypothetical protein ACIGO9_06415 [Nocardia asteroides]|uniref:hypothetical protein n=1 Tax=Nocardia asteroides TaxID=1824 RepID=UPI0037C996F5
MLVTPLSNVATDETGLVRSRSGGWPAVWKGTDPGHIGAQYDLEIDLGDCALDVTICDCDIEDAGIRIDGGRLTAQGKVSTIFDDGLLAVDLNPGTVLIEPVQPISNFLVGQMVAIFPERIEVFPTNI